ncbi:glycosyltransferase family 4 protein [Deinococcus oregonensis]|uniref:Glycosyltransferase family 4 protein n=1 Tax=Deinococcus oregonensis TaxID=1805970 RepID=A0ABV6B6H0_9DEIO
MTIPQSALWYLRGQLSEMQRRGYNTVFVSSVGEAGELEQVAHQEGIRVFPLEVSREIDPLGDVQSMWQLHRLMLKIRPDIVNFGNPKTGLVGGVVAALWRVPVRVYTLHGLRLETAVGAKRQILMWTERLTMSCAHHVVAVSPSLRERTLALGLVSPHKISTLHHGSVNGIRTMNVDAEQVEMLRSRLGIPKEALVYGFVGRLTRDKGIGELISAFQILRQTHPEARLLLVGDFETGDPVDEVTRRQIEASDSILWVGYASDVVSYYGLLDILVLPTYREGFPTVALEGAALGLPLITTDATGARDAVQDGVTGLRVAVGDVNQLADAMQQLADDQPLRRRFGQQGKTWVERDFAQERLWQEWDTLYQRLLTESRSGQPMFGSHRSKRPCMIGAGGIVLLALIKLRTRRATDRSHDDKRG